MKIKTIIIDDERKSIVILENKLKENCPNIEVIGSTQDPKKGIELITKLKPDLVFLDISMPGISGFDILEAIAEPNFELIFVTAYNDYAIEAIEHCAIGYLIKPVLNEKLINSVNTAIKNIEKKNTVLRNQLLINNFQSKGKDVKIIVPVKGGLEFIKINDIIALEGDDGYTKIHLMESENLLSSYRLGKFLKLLENHDFIQIHKSHIINYRYLKKYINEGYVILTNNLKFPVSRGRRDDFLKKVAQIQF